MDYYFRLGCVRPPRGKRFGLSYAHPQANRRPSALALPVTLRSQSWSSP